MKVYDGVIRVSKMGKRDEADESTRTTKQQMKAIEQAAKALGGKVGRVHKYLDQSGFTVLPRVAADIFPRVEAGECAGLIVGYADRLSRNSWEGGAFFIEAAQLDAEVIDAEAPNVDYRTDEGRMVWGMKMLTNEGPSLIAKRKSNTLAEDLLRLGVPGKVAYGYRRNLHVDQDGRIVKTDPERPDKALCPDERTAPVVRRIFELRDDGCSWQAICDALEADGIPTPRGFAEWRHATLAGIVANDAYLGVMHSKNRAPNVEAWEPLVTLAVWNRCQSVVKVTRTGALVAGLAGGLLRCTTCGGSLSVGGTPPVTRKDGTTYRPVTYGCRRRCDGPVYVKRDAADAFVEALIIGIIEDGEGVDLVAHARDIEEARIAWVRAVESRQEFATRDYLAADDHRRGYAQRQQAETDARLHYDELLSRAQDVEGFPVDGTAWRALPEAEKRLVARQLIERIIVHRPASANPRLPVEDRFEVVLVGGVYMARADWQVAA